MRTLIASLARCNRGATAIEYGLIVALIGVGAMAGMSTLGGSAGGLWAQVVNGYSAVNQ